VVTNKNVFGKTRSFLGACLACVGCVSKRQLILQLPFYFLTKKDVVLLLQEFCVFALLWFAKPTCLFDSDLLLLRLFVFCHRLRQLCRLQDRTNGKWVQNTWMSAASTSAKSHMEDRKGGGKLASAWAETLQRSNPFTTKWKVC